MVVTPNNFWYNTFINRAGKTRDRIASKCYPDSFIPKNNPYTTKTKGALLVEYQYEAFISYRHKTEDHKTAVRLQKMLESYKVPGAIRRKSGKRKISRVFRDQEELSVSSDLTEAICEALKQAEFLIVVCSPDTPQSEWVRKEIETFIQYRDREHILTVLVDGEPQTSFPPELLRMSEPLAADFRNQSKKEQRQEFLRLAAPILYCTYDELRQRHREQKLHRWIRAMIAAVFFLGVFGSYSYYQMIEIRNAYTESKRQESRYLAELSLQALEDGDRIKAVELALQALPDSGDRERPVVTQAEYALSQALYLYCKNGRKYYDVLADQMIEIPDRGDDFQISRSGNRLLMRDWMGRLYFWDLEEGTQISDFWPEESDGWGNGYQKAYIIDDDQAVALTQENLECLDITNGNKIWEYKSDISCRQLFLSEDGRYLGAIEDVGDLLSYHGSIHYKIFNRSNGMEYKTIEISDCEYLDIEQTQMNRNGSKIAGFDYSEGYSDEGISLLICDVQKEKSVKIPMMVFRNSKLLWLDERYLAVASKEEVYIDAANVAYRIGVYDTIEGEWRWSKDGEHILGKNLRIVKQSHNDGRDTIVMMSGSTVLGFDCGTGELCVEAIGTGDVLLPIMNSYDGGAIFCSDGSLLVATESGQLVYDHVVKPVAYMFEGHDCFAGITEDGKGLILYRYAGDESYQLLLNMEIGISEACSSKDGKLAAVQEYSRDEKKTIHIVDWSAMKVVRSIVVENVDLFYKLLGFTQAGELLIYNEGIVKFDIGSGLKTEKRLEGYSTRLVCSPDLSKILRIHSKNLMYDAFSVFDTDSMEVIQEQATGSQIEGAVLSEDGEYATLLGKDGTLTFYQWSEKRYEKFAEQPGVNLDRKYRQGQIVGSETGNLLAFFCNKELVQIWDMAQGEMIASIEFPGNLKESAFFSPDNQTIFLQDNQGTFSCYDLKRGQWNMRRIDQIPPVERCQWDESGDRMAVYTKYALHFRNMIMYQKQDDDTWLRYADFPFAEANSADCRTVIVGGDNGDTQLGYFHVRSLEEMREEAETLLEQKGR